MNLFVSLFGISFGQNFQKHIVRNEVFANKQTKKIQGGGSSHIGVEQMSTESS